MCTVTAPFTLKISILDSFWDLGETSCKVVSSLLGANCLSPTSVFSVSVPHQSGTAETRHFQLFYCRLAGVGLFGPATLLLQSTYKVVSCGPGPMRFPHISVGRIYCGLRSLLVAPYNLKRFLIVGI